MTASNKEEFLSQYEYFISPELYDKPIVFEVFTTNEDESKAVCNLRNIMEDDGYRTRKMKEQAKSVVKTVIKNVKELV